MPESPKPAEILSPAPPQVDSGLVDSAEPSSGETSPGEYAQPTLPKIVPFTDLARCGDEIWISHQGQLYRLQSTKAGKLILTK